MAVQAGLDNRPGVAELVAARDAEGEASTDAATERTQANVGQIVRGQL